MSSQPAPWEKYQKAESGPWEKYQPTKQTEADRRAGQSFMQNWTENAGAMYEGELEGLPAQAKGAATAAGMTLPAIALPALAGAAGTMGMVGRVASDPRAWAAVAGGATLLKTGSPTQAAGAAATAYGGSRLSAGILKSLGRFLQNKESARAATQAVKAASKGRSTTTPPIQGRATSTSTAPAEVLPFPERATITVARPAPVARPAAPVAAPKPTAQAEASLEEKLRQSIEAVKSKPVTPKAPAAPLTPAQDTMRQAKELEARIVRMRTENGFSRAQIVDVLKREGIREKGFAKAMVDLVWQAHGLK